MSSATLEAPAAAVPFAAAAESLAASSPAWLASRRRAAWQRWTTLPFPARTHEKWRFSGRRDFSLDAFSAEPVTANRDAALARARVLAAMIPDAAAVLLLADDAVLQVSGKVPEGIVFASLTQALKNPCELLEKHLFTEEPGLGADKFQGLHTSLARSGAVLQAKPGASCDRPVVIIHLASGPGRLLCPHTLVVAEKGSTVSLVEIFASLDETSENAVIASAALHAAEGSSITYTAVQDLNLKSRAFLLNTANAAAKASITSFNLNTGAAHLRHEHHTRLLGEGADIKTYSVSAPSGEQEHDQRTLQTHYAAGATSDLLFKNVLSGDARTFFSGLIKVEPDAQRTDAYQANRNLILSEEAECNSLPGLEILANDVKCTHGSTTGQLDEKELFYFLARGIPRAEARRLLAFGFFEDVLTRHPDQGFMENLRPVLHAKLGGI